MAVVKGKIFFKLKTNFCFYSQLNYSLPRTAIEAEILFAAHIIYLRFLKRLSGKTPLEQNSSGKKIGAVWCSGADRRSFEASAVLHFVFFEVIVNKMQQSAKENCLLKRNTVPEVFPLTIGSGKTMPFEKRHAGCEEREKINRRRIYDTLRINFFEATKQTACIFSKGDKNNPQGLRVHKHIFVGNSRLVTAMTHTDNNGDNAEQREKRYYYHSDHLGSAQFVTDWRGRQYEHIEYTPYGELWIEEVAAGLDKLPFRFTGKEMDEETGLYYYGARYLDPKYSRWISTDPALSEYMAGSSVGAGGIYNTVNFNVYHYGNNNPIKYTDPTGMWIDNGDGTYTAEKGDTLWDKYGADWKEKSGFTRDPRTLQVGETVGEKNRQNNDSSDPRYKPSQENIQQPLNPITASDSYDFSKETYVPVEGIGILGNSRFTGSITMTNKSMSIFASGAFAAQNLVDDYFFSGDAALFVDGNKVGNSHFKYPNSLFIANGYPFRTIGEANFNHDFSNAKLVEIDLYFRVGIAVDFGVNRFFINYSKERIRVK